MPELPEVETTKRGIAPHIIANSISEIKIHNDQLRWPVPANLPEWCNGQKVTGIERRAKYIVIKLESHWLLIHLGMSGSLRILDAGSIRQKHDHIEILFDNQKRLIFNDPRRFGCFLSDTPENITHHKLLTGLGPEPLSDDFNGSGLKAAAKGRSGPVKNFIMDQSVVVGVGNIYANEALFKSGISPVRSASNISLKRYESLANHIKQVLSAAIDMGGTTLRDFVGGDGKPGYFQQTLNVYGRGGLPCHHCGKPLKEIRLGQRTTVYCKYCQK